MASYQQANEYQTYALRPYELPYDAIMKTVLNKNEFWRQGAERLKNAYQNAAGLSLSLDGNRQSLKGFMDQAGQEVTKAAKSDLSDPDNVTSSLKIFDPIYSTDTEFSKNIMGDHAITSRAKEIQGKYEQLKTANGGKGYSNVNQQYSLDAYGEFIKGNDPKSWQTHLNNLKDTIPYYDYKPELDKAMSNCKSTTSTPYTDGMYTGINTHTGIDKGCLAASLSPNAERQMQIEGFVKYGKNYEALRDQYLPVLISDRDQLAKERARLGAKLANSMMSKDDSDRIHQTLDSYKDRMDNLDRSLEKIHSGDLSDIKNNYETIAGSVMKGQKLDAISRVFADKTTRVGDDIQKMWATFRQQKELLTQKELYDAASQESDQQFKLLLKGAAKGQPDPQAYIPTAGPTNEVISGIKEHDAKLADKVAQLKVNDQYLLDAFKTDPRLQKAVTNGAKPGTPEFDGLIQGLMSDYLNTAGNSPIRLGLDKRNALLWEKKSLDMEQAIIESTAASKSARADVASFVNTVNKPIDIKTPTGTISLQPQQIRDLLTKNQSGNIKLTWRNSTFQGNYGQVVPTDINGNKTGIIREHVLEINGQQIPVGNTPLQPYLVQTESKLGDYTNVLNKQYQQHYVAQHPFLDLSSLNSDTPGKEINSLRRRIAGALGSVANIKSTDAAESVQLVGTRFDGSVVVNITGKKQGEKYTDWTDKELREGFGSIGITDVKKVDGTKNQYILNNINEYDRRGQISQIQQIQDFAENITKLKQQGGDVQPYTPMPDYKGVQLVARTDPNGSVLFQMTDPKTGFRSFSSSAAELVKQLDTITKDR